MPVLRRLQNWWTGRRPRPLNQLLAVEFDDIEVRVRVLERLDPEWNQSFPWADITRVCFKDGGIYSSDTIFIVVRGNEQPISVLTEAKGGNDFFGALTERGYFPEEIWRKAMGETGGAMHCWPP